MLIFACFEHSGLHEQQGIVAVSSRVHVYRAASIAAIGLKNGF